MDSFCLMLANKVPFPMFRVVYLIPSFLFSAQKFGGY